ncbi:MAG: Rap1a/Tai family immunity protein [Pseudomonadales bacterium]|nr:Rap1a/Tai family immunity protein [Pseudomonadales bacterium]
MKHNLSLLAITILTLVLSSTASAAYFQTTYTIIKRCEEPPKNIKEQTAEFVKIANGLSSCYAYLMAVGDGLDASELEVTKSSDQSKIKRWPNDVCLPRSVDQEDLRKVFIGYTEKYPYPELTGTNPAYVVAQAFALRWPCATED